MEEIYRTIIPNPSRAAILLQESLNGWSLPSFTFEDQHLWQAVGHINQSVREQYQIEATTLNCIQIVVDEPMDQIRYYYGMENHTPATIPTFGSFWVPVEDVDSHLEGEQLEVFQQWRRLGEVKPVPKNRVPWYQPKWFKQAQKWIDDQLIPLGFTRTAPMEQIRSWQRASMWKIPTDEADLYFKAVPSMFHYEPILTQNLSVWFPGQVPGVLAADMNRNWLLMDNAGSESLNTIDQAEHWEAAIRSYAEIQIELTHKVSELFEIGVPDRRLQHYPRWIDELFSNLTAFQQGPVGLTNEEINHLMELQPALIGACEQLASYAIPKSLEHGDFWSGQVLLNQNQYAFIDWSDASISHPFLSTWFFMAELTLELPNIPDACDRLTHAYLEPWSTFLPTRELFEAFELAQFLGPIHHALIYDQQILPNMEIQWEMERMLPNALRQLL